MRRLFRHSLLGVFVLCVVFWLASLFGGISYETGRVEARCSSGLVGVMMYVNSSPQGLCAVGSTEPQYWWPLVAHSTSRTVVAVPLWMPLVVTGGLGAYMVWRDRRPRPGFCRKCGYDLRGTPERCPECGSEAKLPARN